MSVKGMNKFVPPHWNPNNVKFPDKDIDEMIGLFKEIVPKQNHNYSSFWNKCNPEVKWLPRYKEIIKDVLDHIGVHRYSEYTFNYWGQLYLNDDLHGVHHHFHEAVDDKVDLSFVHFVRVDKPLFRFVNRKGDYYIPKQEEGDLLWFPSWVWHEVIPNKSDKERFIVAGNISIKYMTCPN